MVLEWGWIFRFFSDPATRRNTDGNQHNGQSSLLAEMRRWNRERTNHAHLFPAVRIRSSRCRVVAAAVTMVAEQAPDQMMWKSLWCACNWATVTCCSAI